MIAIVFILAILIAGALAMYVINRIRLNQWMRSPQPPGRLITSGDKRWYLTVKGIGRFAVIIETRLGGPSPEWWHIQGALVDDARVVTYDRAGYGWSDLTTNPRTSLEIAHELRATLESANVPGPYILVGHSQGGLYAQHFARLFPNEVAGCIFLDPLSTENDRFAKELDPRVYQGSGVDKRSAMQMTGLLSKIGLLSLLKPLMMKSPPFYYYKNLSPEIIEIIWRYHLRPELYATSLKEYEQALQLTNLQQLAKRDFPNIPVTVIYHSAAIIIDEIVKYGGLSQEDAQKVEALWEILTRSYLDLATNSQWIAADHSSHFIPLDQPDLVISIIKEMLQVLDRQELII